LKEVGKPKPMVAKTKPVHVYKLESVKPTILRLRAELETNLEQHGQTSRHELGD
jgi:hypothetical protein